MKLGITAALAFVALLACSSALPAKKRMVYYHQPAAAQFYGAPQRMMYVQYVQPVQTHARSTQGAEALVAGDAVATGTYLKAAANDDALAAAGAHGAQSVAEAYPAEPAVEIEAEAPAAAAEPADDEAKVPREYNFEAVAPAAEEPEPVAAAAPAPAAAPVKPANRYLPAQKKKVIVELEQPSEEEETNAADEEVDNAAAVADEETAAAAAAVDDEQEEDDLPARVPNARRPAVRKPTKAAAQKPPAKAPAGAAKPLPAGTFFPIDFGGTNGGAIAIANSFSTGEGGSATSHAIAYGSPDAVRARARPSKYH